MRLDPNIVASGRATRVLASSLVSIRVGNDNKRVGRPKK